jgi:uncharacterized small protein (TIGR04563 family)
MVPRPIRAKPIDKQTVKLPTGTLEEMRAEAVRLERSLSWVAQEAWRRARGRIKGLPPVRI